MAGIELPDGHEVEIILEYLELNEEACRRKEKAFFDDSGVICTDLQLLLWQDDHRRWVMAMEMTALGQPVQFFAVANDQTSRDEMEKFITIRVTEWLVKKREEQEASGAGPSC